VPRLWAPRIFKLGTRVRSVVSFTTRPLYSRRNFPQYPLHGWLGGPQSQSGRGGKVKNPFQRRESNASRPARSLVTGLLSFI
jgi:hypothetical protein